MPIKLSRRKLLVGRVTLVLLATILVVASYEFLLGFPRHYEGQWVHRITKWYGYSLVLPIPYMRGEIYYSYEDEQGREIRHGPFFQVRAGDHIRGLFLHDKMHGVWTVTDEQGRLVKKELFVSGKKEKTLDPNHGP